MKLKNVANLINKKIETCTLNKPEYISTENMKSNFGGVSLASHIPSGKCTRFLKDDVLISNIRPYFKKIWSAKFNGGCSNDILVLRNNKNINPKFLFYLICNDKFINYYSLSCKGTKMPRGNKEALLEWEFNLPSLEIQQHIVNTIGSIDDLIEENSFKIKLLQELGFNYFLDKIRKDYELINISNLHIKYGMSLVKNIRIKGEIPLLASNGVIDYISKFNSENAIVFGCRGTLGKVFYCKGKCFILNTAFFVNNNINYGNIYFSLIYEKGLVTYQSGAAQPQITIDAIKDVKLKIPKNNNLNKVLDCICNYQEQIKKLKWIKQLLLLKHFK